MLFFMCDSRSEKGSHPLDSLNDLRLANGFRLDLTTFLLVLWSRGGTPRVQRPLLAGVSANTEKVLSKKCMIIGNYHYVDHISITQLNCL